MSTKNKDKDNDSSQSLSEGEGEGLDDNDDTGGSFRTPKAPREQIHPRRALFEAFHSLAGEAETTSQSQTQSSKKTHATSMPPEEGSQEYLMKVRRSLPPCRGSTCLEIMQDIAKDIENYEEIRFHQKISAINGKNTTCIREVWEKDLYEEFANIRKLREQYNFVAMDTEFPGVFCKFPSSYNKFPPKHSQYDEIRANVNNLKLIQLGLTLMDKDGNTPPGICTWQFNFKFSLLTDIYAVDSIKMLIKAGVQFQKHEVEGIDHDEFAYYFTTSGLVLTGNTEFKVTWVTFHCGYDFAYLTKILCGKDMPEHEAFYIRLVKIYFPRVFDIKYMMQDCQQLHGGLQDVATCLGVSRHGIQHQAGSDSLLTGEIFFKIKQLFIENNMDVENFNGCLYGFRTTYQSVEAEAAILDQKMEERKLAEEQKKQFEKQQELAKANAAAEATAQAHIDMFRMSQFFGTRITHPHQTHHHGEQFGMMMNPRGHAYQVRLSGNFGEFLPRIPDVGPDLSIKLLVEGREKITNVASKFENS